MGMSYSQFGIEFPNRRDFNSQIDEMGYGLGSRSDLLHHDPVLLPVGELHRDGDADHAEPHVFFFFLLVIPIFLDTINIQQQTLLSNCLNLSYIIYVSITRRQIRIDFEAVGVGVGAAAHEEVVEVREPGVGRFETGGVVVVLVPAVAAAGQVCQQGGGGLAPVLGDALALVDDAPGHEAVVERDVAGAELVRALGLVPRLGDGVRVAARAPGPPALARAPRRVRRLPRRLLRRRHRQRLRCRRLGVGVGVGGCGGGLQHLAAADPDGAVLPPFPLHRLDGLACGGFLGGLLFGWRRKRAEERGGLEVVGNGNYTSKGKGKGERGRTTTRMCGWASVWESPRGRRTMAGAVPAGGCLVGDFLG